jgi:hypothetical protein
MGTTSVISLCVDCRPGVEGSTPPTSLSTSSASVLTCILDSEVPGKYKHMDEMINEYDSEVQDGSKPHQDEKKEMGEAS